MKLKHIPLESGIHPRGSFDKKVFVLYNIVFFPQTRKKKTKRRGPIGCSTAERRGLAGLKMITSFLALEPTIQRHGRLTTLALAYHSKSIFEHANRRGLLQKHSNNSLELEERSKEASTKLNRRPFHLIVSLSTLKTDFWDVTSVSRELRMDWKGAGRARDRRAKRTQSRISTHPNPKYGISN